VAALAWVRPTPISVIAKAAMTPPRNILDLNRIMAGLPLSHYKSSYWQDV